MRIKEMMLQKYNSYARQLQVEGSLQQIGLQNVMAEVGITNIRKELNFLVNKSEELSSQWHLKFQSEWHRIIYLYNVVAEFSVRSLYLMENINSQYYTFNRFITALFGSIHAEYKLKLMPGESAGPSEKYSVFMNTHIE